MMKLTSIWNETEDNLLQMSLRAFDLPDNIPDLWLCRLYKAVGIQDGQYFGGSLFDKLYFYLYGTN